MTITHDNGHLVINGNGEEILFVTINGRQYDLHGNVLPMQDERYITALRQIRSETLQDRGFTKKTSRRIADLVCKVLE